MAVIIKFNTDEDAENAFDILLDEDEGYSSAPEHRIVISNRAARILRARAIHFEVFGPPLPAPLEPLVEDPDPQADRANIRYKLNEIIDYLNKL